MRQWQLGHSQRNVRVAYGPYTTCSQFLAVFVHIHKQILLLVRNEKFLSRRKKRLLLLLYPKRIQLQKLCNGAAWVSFPNLVYGTKILDVVLPFCIYVIPRHIQCLGKNKSESFTFMRELLHFICLFHFQNLFVTFQKLIFFSRQLTKVSTCP